MFSLTSNSRNTFLENMMTGFIKACSEYSAGGNMKSPSDILEQIQWEVQCNWAPKDVVIKSFSVCGITQTDLAKISAALN